MKWDAIIANGTVVDQGRTGQMDVRVKDERVESLVPAGGGYPPDAPVIDASGKLVLPGIIDAHNHPVYADRIGAFSKAALSGGSPPWCPTSARSRRGTSPVAWWMPSRASSKRPGASRSSISACTPP